MEDNTEFDDFLVRESMKIVKVTIDDNTLYRSIAQQLYGDEEMFPRVQKRTTEFLDLVAKM